VLLDGKCTKVPVMRVVLLTLCGEIGDGSSAQGRSDGGGYIGIYTHPKSVHLKFYGVFFLLPVKQRLVS